MRGEYIMGMYRLEISRMADQDRQTIIDLLMPKADDGRIFNGTVTGIGTISACYEDSDTAHALALDCETTVFCKAEVDYHPTDRPMREKREQAASQQVASPPYHPKEVERQLPEGMRLVTLHDSEEGAHHGVLRVAARGIAALLFHLPSQFDPYCWAVTVSSEVDRRALLRSLYPTWAPLRSEEP
jgi:hypothetical protein